MHITRKMWQALEDGRLPKELFDQYLLDHHMSTCELCAREYEAAHRKPDYSSVFEHVEAGLAELEQRVAEERLRASEDLEALVALEPEKRLDRVQRARHRFRSPLLAEQLLMRSFGALPDDPRTSLHFATLAAAVVAESRRHGAAEARILALTHQGNALRALGRLPDAAKAFQQARNLLRIGLDTGSTRQAVTDLGVSALVDWMEGAYFKEVCEFDKAEELLTRAAVLYALEQSTVTVHQVILTMAEMFSHQGRTDDAIEAVSRVLANLGEEDHPRLYWMARFSHATYLTDAGLFGAAREELAAFRAASPDLAEGYVMPRVHWVEGRIAFGLGEFDKAERSFTAARRTYLAQQSGINMALVSLDLALVYLRLRRPDKLLAIAEEMALIFDTNDVHREAIAALMLFQEAVRQEAVSSRYLDRLRRYLEAARHNPSLQFEKPS